MIDASLNAPLLPMLIFQLKQFFWLDLWPMLVGFATIFCYQIYARIPVSGAKSKTLVFAMSSTASMVTLFGWATIVRSTQMIPLYGCGVGLASVLVSQIYPVTLPRHRWLRVPFPKVVWSGDQDGVRRFQEAVGITAGSALRRGPTQEQSVCPSPKSASGPGWDFRT